jgi:ribose-phosphate pyrophosphokinase
VILLNGTIVEFEVFPNGETRIKESQILDNVLVRNVVTFKYESDGDLIKLLFTKKYLDEQGAISHLKIYYMPYSRMDRKEGNSAFTLKYVSDFINSLGFINVEIMEPHSDVAAALINHSYATYPTIEILDKVIKEIKFSKENDYIFFPDAGAQKRYSKVIGYRQLVGFKKRNFQTGQIEDLQVVGDIGNGAKVLIVDDLCSFGGTFMLSAEKLKELGAAEIYLLVGHCEHSIYKGKILETDLIQKVFTTNTILDKAEHEKIKIFYIGGN